ncbi:MAG: PadR family transcriptional regulator [Candidatus Hydrogenedentota bacterium]
MTPNDSLANWKTQLRKGFLDLCILRYLNAREFYGYDLVQELRKVDGTAMREGIIYPVLARLQEDGLVTNERRLSNSGPPRKYYQITPEGQRVLMEMEAHWRRIAEAMAAPIRLEKEHEHA